MRFSPRFVFCRQQNRAFRRSSFFCQQLVALGYQLTSTTLTIFCSYVDKVIGNSHFAHFCFDLFISFLRYAIVLLSNVFLYFLLVFTAITRLPTFFSRHRLQAAGYVALKQVDTARIKSKYEQEHGFICEQSAEWLTRCQGCGVAGSWLHQ